MKTKIIPTEHDEAVALTKYLEILKKQKKIKLFSHIANETFTKNWGTKMKNKQEGVRSGVPDYLILGNKDIFFIELKRVKNGVVSGTQKEWLTHLNYLGFNSVVCKGFIEAKKYLEERI